MESSWIPSKLSDVVEIHTGKISVDEAELADYISTDNLLPDFGGVNPAEKMPATGKVTTYKVGDILFSNIRTYFKKLWLADKSGSCSNDVIVFSPKNGIENEYIYHLLMNDEFIEYTVKTSKGTKMPRGDKDAIMKYEFLLAPQHERKFIGDSLVRYKKKIELNRQSNQTLEQMAQALFKSWFVDFDPVIDNALAAGNDIPEALQHKAEQRKQTQQLPDFKRLPEHIRALFPSEFEQTDEANIGIAGWIPKGWKTEKFKKVIDKYIDNRGKTPPLCDGGIPLIEVKNLPENSSFPALKTEKRVTEETFKTWFRQHVEEKDILISTVGTIGRTSFIKDTQLAIAQNVLGLRFGKKVLPEYMFYLIKGHKFQHDVDARLVITVQASIKRKDLDTIDILIPSNNVQTTFSEIVSSYLESQYNNSCLTLKLETIRDTLLPKLISGEITINKEVA